MKWNPASSDSTIYSLATRKTFRRNSNISHNRRHSVFPVSGFQDTDLHTISSTNKGQKPTSSAERLSGCDAAAD